MSWVEYLQNFFLLTYLSLINSFFLQSLYTILYFSPLLQ